MGAHSPPPRRSQEAAHTLCKVLESLESLWERERQNHPHHLVSASQLRVLYALDNTAGVSLRDLGEALDSAPSPLSRLCTRLEATGFVRRAPSAQSGREIELHLTHRATDYLTELRQGRERALAEVLDTMAPAQRDALIRSAEILRTAADRHPGGAAEERAARSA
ncbi:MarR family transcriptional regulator [Streptomyces sp. p1417]|uniref:MarR family transcriptional regulator n=1 Tax=Streptomyces typhae TaxID=2681492 RepID=A0A6L6X5X9_9ACTN|nr:MarR family transcriptional regulator [Streptomyces typhae]MVO89168.1 MarR family transcriptional regulator [Streptomyces typhae]